MKYPEYHNRKGSKCYFSCDSKSFEKDPDTQLKLIGFHTLFLLGFAEENVKPHQKNLIIVDGTTIEKISLNECLEALSKNTLRYKVFHDLQGDDKKLFTGIKGKEFVFTHELVSSNQLLKNNTLDAKRNANDKYPCMFDTFIIDIIKDTHYFEPGDEKEYLVLERISEFEKMFEDPDYCQFCNSDSDKSDLLIDSDKIYNKREIVLNNLIFDFEKYDFFMAMNKNKAVITFDKRAIGGYKHASFYTAAGYTVLHGVEKSLKHKQSTYINQINFEFTEMDNEIIVISIYRGIDVL